MSLLCLCLLLNFCEIAVLYNFSINGCDVKRRIRQLSGTGDLSLGLNVRVA